MFSFSGGTITELQNQLSNDSARSIVMVGLWNKHSDRLLPEWEFETKLKEGWSQCKWKASVTSIDRQTTEQGPSHVDSSLT